LAPTQPAGEPDTVLSLGDAAPTFGINLYSRMRDDSSLFSDRIAFAPLSPNKVAARYGDTPAEIEADEVGGNFFSALGVRMAAGQLFAPVDEGRHSQVAVISHGYRTRRFDRTPSIIRKVICVNDVPMTVVGATGPRFYGVDSGVGSLIPCSRTWPAARRRRSGFRSFPRQYLSAPDYPGPGSPPDASASCSPAPAFPASRRRPPVRCSHLNLPQQRRDMLRCLPPPSRQFQAPFIPVCLIPAGTEFARHCIRGTELSLLTARRIER